MLAYKYLVLCIVLVFLLYLAMACWQGRRLVRLRPYLSFVAPRHLPGSVYGIVLRKHRTYTTAVFWILIVAVVVIEFGVQKFHIMDTGAIPYLFYVHLPLAAVFLLCMVCAKFWLTGSYSAVWHRRTVYAGLCTGVGSVGTGSVLLYWL